MCGEKLTSPDRGRWYAGSPPRARGEEVLQTAGITLRRITPACAGRSLHAQLHCVVAEDHPRVRGEKPLFSCRLETVRGSPPRARGEELEALDKIPAVRITPACAGRSFIFCNAATISSHHPRVCGEKLTGKNSAQTEKGSPPRVRGEGPPARGYARRSRITPACAGRRGRRLLVPRADWDHPRVCGEKAVQRICRAPCGGSPPRVRGEGIRGCAAGAARGITPACAGRRDRIHNPHQPP